MTTSHLKLWTKSSLLALSAAALLFTAGCGPTYVAGPPPPGPPPLVEQADQTGFHMGFDHGARDVSRGFGYHPRADRAFRDTPGYDPRFGPFPVYRGHFRNAYLRGYDQGFHRG